MLPPGVNAKDFSDAVKQFEAAVGKEWVFTRRLLAILGRARRTRCIGRRRSFQSGGSAGGHEDR